MGGLSTSLGQSSSQKKTHGDLSIFDSEIKLQRLVDKAEYNPGPSSKSRNVHAGQLLLHQGKVSRRSVQKRGSQPHSKLLRIYWMKEGREDLGHELLELPC